MPWYSPDLSPGVRRVVAVLGAAMVLWISVLTLRIPLSGLSKFGVVAMLIAGLGGMAALWMGRSEDRVFGLVYGFLFAVGTALFLLGTYVRS